MAPFYYRRLFALLIFALSGSFAWSQNLAPNPSFEVFTVCPSAFGAGGALQCTPWISATSGTSDYFNACAPPNFVGVPVNYFGQEPAHTGQAYAGGYAHYTFAYREYIQAPLTSPLLAGEYYYFGMYVSLADNQGCGVPHLGAYFSVNPPPNSGVLWLNVTPQVESEIGYISNTDGWTLIEGCFFAAGGEAYVTIGNFQSDANSALDPDCPNGNTQIAYYYIDDVTVSATTLPAPIDFDLGGPVVACSEYTIDPQIPGVIYHWEDGSNGSTLTVTESGTYSLTVTAGCSFGIDEIDVEIIGDSDPVDIGPDMYTLCQGETYTISLDPSAGSYSWSNGSSSPTLNITTPGLYVVTLDDDGCDVTTDQVLVDVIQPPAPFTLGPDTYICPGTDISFSFDPSLGDFMWNTGSTSSHYSIDMPGSYSLTISNMCGEFVDDIDVELILPPDIDFGPDPYLVCYGDLLEFEFDPDMGDYLWLDGSTNNFIAVTEPGHYHVTVINVCGVDDADLYVEAIPDPIVDLGPDLTLCSAQLPVLLDVSNSGGDSFLWQDGSADSEFLVTDAGTYSVTVANACVEVSDVVNITVGSSDVLVDLPPDQILCAGETLLLSNTGDPGDYLWQDNSTAATFLVSSPGTYVLTVTTPCGSASDSIVVDYVSPIGVPDLGPDLALCPGEQLVLAPAVSGVSFLWQDMSTADSLVVTGPGTYYVQVSDQCTAASDTIEITLNNNPPLLALPAQLNLCQGQSLTLDAGIGGVTYLWNNNSTASTLSVNTPGTYSLTVSNACGTDADTIVVLDGGPAPLVELGNDVALCAGDVITLTPVFSDVTSWLWNNGSTLPSYTITGSETVTVAVSNACGTSYDTLIASLLPATPALDLGSDTSLCPGNTLLLTINTPNVNIQWSDGSGNTQFLANGPGSYFATISSACGSNSDTINIGLLPGAPVLNLGMDQSLCPGEIITLSPGVTNASYLWQDGSTSSTYNATDAETVILIVSNACGTATDTLEITISTDGPVVNLGPDVLACEGDVVTLMSDISGVQYLWQDGSTASSLSTSSSGTFVLQVSNNCGVDKDTVIVDIDGTPPDTELGPDTTLCKGNTLLLSSTSDPGTIVRWQDGSTTPTFLVNAPGTFILSESNHCGDHLDSIRVDFLDAPLAFDLGPDTTICPGEFLLLTVPQSNLTIQWQDGSSGNTLVADKAQIYSLQLSNPCGVASDALALTFDTNIPVITLDPSLTLCPGDIIELDVTQPFSASYSWNTGEHTSFLEVETPGSYAVTVTALCAEEHNQVVVLQGSDCFPVALFLPNVFSPNNDNINDVFQLSTNAEVRISDLHGSIFDRWGNLVFDSKAVPFVWDGTFNQELMQPGVYVYSIILDYSVNGLQRHTVLKGDVTLVR